MNYDIKINEYGTKCYYLNNVLHIEDCPDTEYTNGYKAWYKNNNFHREDGPAIEYTNGDKYWYKNGFLHREDGPAIESTNHEKSWYLNNKYYGKNDKFTNESWERFVKTLIFS